MMPGYEENIWIDLPAIGSAADVSRSRIDELKRSSRSSMVWVMLGA